MQFKKNAGVAGYAESFCTVQSDLQASEQARYSVNDVLGLILQKHRKDSALKRISIAGLENAFCKKALHAAIISGRTEDSFLLIFNFPWLLFQLVHRFINN